MPVLLGRVGEGSAQADVVRGDGAAVQGAFGWVNEWLFTYTVEGETGVFTGDIIGSVPGDADSDGDVDAFDIQQILVANSFMNGTGWSWGDGDFDRDGDVDGDDIQLVLATGLYGQGPYAPGGGSAPEPAALTLLAIGGFLLLRRTPKSRSHRDWTSAAGRLDAHAASMEGGAK